MRQRAFALQKEAAPMRSLASRTELARRPRSQPYVNFFLYASFKPALA